MQQIEAKMAEKIAPILSIHSLVETPVPTGRERSQNHAWNSPLLGREDKNDVIRIVLILAAFIGPE